LPNTNVMRGSVGSHHQPQHNRALVFCLASFVGEFRFWSIDNTRGNDSSAYTI
jgi:hypothetical protein